MPKSSHPTKSNILNREQFAVISHQSGRRVYTGTRAQVWVFVSSSTDNFSVRAV